MCTGLPCFAHSLHLRLFSFWVHGMELRNVKALINGARNRLDVGDKLIFNAFEAEAVLRCDQVDGKTQVTISP